MDVNNIVIYFRVPLSISAPEFYPKKFIHLHISLIRDIYLILSSFFLGKLLSRTRTIIQYGAPNTLTQST